MKSLSLGRAFLLIFSLMCAWQVEAQEREVACVYKEEYCASTNRGTSKMLAPARGVDNNLIFQVLKMEYIRLLFKLTMNFYLEPSSLADDFQII
jgi:hypothetical protein